MNDNVYHSRLCSLWLMDLFSDGSLKREEWESLGIVQAMLVEKLREPEKTMFDWVREDLI